MKIFPLESLTLCLNKNTTYIQDPLLISHDIFQETIPSKELIYTSSLFFIPALYGFYYSINGLSIITTTTALFSINYWSNTESRIGFFLDVFFARFSGITYFIYGYKYITNPTIRYNCYFNTCLMISCYVFSNILYNLGRPEWVKFHMAFHFFTTIGKLLVLSQIRNNKL
jgi:hypothetical protein